MTSTNEEVERALSLLPMQSVKFACGYGSRVLEGAVTSQLGTVSKLSFSPGELC
jgi:hypothetical protein